VLYILFFYCILELFLQCCIFYFSIVLWNSSYSVVYFIFLLYFRTLPTVLYILIFLLYFGTLPTVLYNLIFLLYFRTLPTVLYILFFYCILELFLQCCIFYFSIVLWNSSYSVVYFIFAFYFPISSAVYWEREP
jgi:hypothetical protein